MWEGKTNTILLWEATKILTFSKSLAPFCVFTFYFGENVFREKMRKKVIFLYIFKGDMQSNYVLNCRE